MEDIVVDSSAILAVYILTFLIGLPTNAIALYAFSVKIHKKPGPTEILLLNLTVSDLLFLMSLPLKMHEAASGMVWTLPIGLCSVTTYIYFLTIYTSSLLLMAVSVVRYIGVAHPIAYKHLRRSAYAVAASAVIWFTTAAHCSLVFIVQHLPNIPKTNSTICYENFQIEQLEIVLPVRLEFFVVLCLIPVLVCTFCYVRTIWILHSRKRISNKRKCKVIGMAVGTLAVFLVSVLPFNISHVMGYIQGFSPKWRNYTLLLITFNTCLDPIIFYFSSFASEVTCCRIKKQHKTPDKKQDTESDKE